MSKLQDYPQVTNPRRRRTIDPAAEEESSRGFQVELVNRENLLGPRRFAAPKSDLRAATPNIENLKTTNPRAAANASALLRAVKNKTSTLRRGHSLSYFGLLLFTLLVYFRPYELVSSLSWMTRGALVAGIVTLIIFVPSQLSLEGTLTARTREVNLVLLFCALGLVSVAFAKESRLEGWNTFSNIFIRAVVMFIVIVNVVRTEKRLRGLILVLLGSGCYLSIIALNDYRLGLLTVEGYRVKGAIGGIFDNPNDLAIHLVTMFPLAIALLLASRGFIKKAIFAACALLMLAATTVTFSRGGFLALLAAGLALAWTLGKKNRVLVTVALCILVVGFLAFAPGGYGSRILSIFDRSLDAYGSGESREALLMQSIKVAIRNPLFGIGMGNFPFVSFHDMVSHNSYTQVAAEMGFGALIIYLAFQITPLKRLRRIIRETLEDRRGSLSYYLAVGLFASLVGFMVASFFGSVAYYWNVYYLVGCAAALWRVYEATHTPEATASEKAIQAMTLPGRAEQVAPLPAR